MNKVILLDRDGVINYDSLHYIKSEAEYILIPESVDAIARLTEAGYKIGLATNQSGVSRGLYSEDTLLAIHQKMVNTIEEAGGRIDAIEYCIHLPEKNCACRKPKPGMLYALAQKLKCSLEGVPFVGDRISDIQAAQAVGAYPVMILSSMTDRQHLQNYPQIPTYDSLAAFVDTLLANPK
ncbi:D-glycero-beta-D-manno-heptose 1,7-bisphosphate 7-phosphatase [Legionella sp. km772]|uniref:D-glycero-beta-D-manno-heptose 1,7-bisphosphate 7-phosphatase n=1 Tax=Legionella sp. km772 TaxID=2498111 RepID=UPI000F8D1C16|nr:D-glycero-beta-D-manno-heptose 1,7-bisphosphate 7-phosphatase [Legionella sp. km772]RUR12681.1 D-glycero-beta-D-manno-heptose 1,7-bisphosphate 7-phosphatase [Legionella sp. km772]